MIKRYRQRRVVKNKLDQYSELFRNRNVNFIEHFSTPSFSYITVDEYKNLQIVKHVWKQGDRYYKLAEKYYSDATDWWIIARFNLKPTESHVAVGDIILIPTPLDLVINYMAG